MEYANGSKHWYINGKPHRENGPAVEYANCSKAWYLNGFRMTEQEHAQKTRAKKTCLILDGKEIEISSETIENLKKVLGV